jgi:CBS domain-containing protein
MEIQGTVRDIVQNKAGNLWSTTPEASVYEAIRLMGEKGIGALVVLENEVVVGVLSERDYSRKVVLQGRTSRDTKVGEILSHPVITVRPGDSIGHCMQLMTTERIRHLPVVDERNHPLGVVSMGDLVKWVMLTQSQTIQQLHGYISGEYPG